MNPQPELSGDATKRFTGRTDDYIKYRPSYPGAAIDAVLAGLGDPTALRIADIGAGTGIATRLLGARGADVLAVEPNADMRAAAQSSGLRVHAAKAEATGLPAASFDAVTIFQAFHWLDTKAALNEFARVLRPGGRIAIVWNIRDDADPFTRGYGDIFDREREREIAKTFDFDWHAVPECLNRAGLYDVRKQSFAYVQELDGEGLLGRARSASYVPLAGPQRDEILAKLSAWHAQNADAAGAVALHYRTDVFLAHTAGP